MEQLQTVSPFVSVVIPIYKVEQYLRQCVDSVLAQDYQNMEVILVDDGSSDGCPAICDEYANKDSRIKVIHKPNGGLADARNAGIAATSGDWLICLDSDDYWSSPSALSSAISVLRQNPEVDIVYIRNQVFWEDENRKAPVSPEISQSTLASLDSDSQVEYLVETGNLIPSSCWKLVKTSILKENGIEFTKGLLSEDIDWNFDLMLKVKGKIAACYDFIYCYRKRKGSITRSMTVRNIDHLLYVLEKWIMRIPDADVSEQRKRALMSYVAYQWSILLALYQRVTIEEGKSRYNTEQWRRIKRLKFLTYYKGNRKFRKVRILIRMVGLKRASWLLGYYLRVR